MGETNRRERGSERADGTGRTSRREEPTPRHVAPFADRPADETAARAALEPGRSGNGGTGAPGALDLDVSGGVADHVEGRR